MKEETIGVVGLGLLGRGIAACFLGHGFRVAGYAREAGELLAAEAAIEGAIGEMIERGGFDPSLAGEWKERFVASTEMGALRGCDFVIESVIEDAAIKAAVFDEVEAVVGPAVPVASNTSAIPITTLQAGRKQPGRFLGMHWAAPAYATRAMELIRGEKTGDGVMENAVALVRRVGKEPYVVDRDVPGFVMNRMAYAVYREALHLMEEGIADAETIDLAWRNAAGVWAAMCGPLRWIDLTGGPVLYASVMERILGDLSRATEVSPVMKKLVEEGAEGTRNGRGFYQYTDEEVVQWEKLFRDHAWSVWEQQKREFPL
jgi:3-hydroxybutyryl-CoA dehydrogenase